MRQIERGGRATYALVMRIVLMAVLVLAGCMDKPGAVHPDAGPLPIDAPDGCPALSEASKFDFFGESCTAAPYPANTLCHGDMSGDDHGWCIGPASGGAGICRPMAYDASRCPVCPSGTLRYTAGEAAYCAP